jgi:hypothetical protein
MKYERKGKPQLPDWWTDLAFPLLDKASYKSIATHASAHACRESPWTASAISKFVSGAARTRELANGISYALGIPQPFFTARSEKEAKALTAVMEASEPLLSEEQRARLRELDLFGTDAAPALPEADQTPEIQFRDDEGKTRRGRTRRAAHKRS